MEKQIFIINGSGGVGKDTFVKLVTNQLNLQMRKNNTVMNFSSIDKVVEAAEILGYNHQKSDKDRKFLSDLKQLAKNYNDSPHVSLRYKVAEFLNNTTSYILFLHIREIDEISRAVEEFSAKTILIVRDSVKHIESNESDKNVFDYNYDIVIRNDGSLEDLGIKALEFIGGILTPGM